MSVTEPGGGGEWAHFSNNGGNRAYRVRTLLNSLTSMIFQDFFYDLL